MGDAVAIPGLETVLAGVPAGHVVLVEGGLAPAKNYLARRWADAAAAQGRKVAYVHTAPHLDAPGAVAPVRPVPAKDWGQVKPQAGEDVVVDSFSLLNLGSHGAEVAHRVRQLQEACRQQGTSAVLVVDEGQLDGPALAACRHLADGVLQFHERDDPEGPIPFVRAPKWVDGKPRDRNLYYTYDGARLLVDTRRRVN